MDLALYISQLANPLAGMTVSVPLAIKVLHLPCVAVLAPIVPVNLIEVGIIHLAWQALLRRPRIRRWIEARRSARVAAWLDRRGVFIAAVAATFVVGAIPTYISLRYLGAPLGGRIAAGVALGCAVFGAAITGVCALFPG